MLELLCGFQGNYIRLDINDPQRTAATSKSSFSPSLTADPKDISIAEEPEENDLVRGGQVNNFISLTEQI